MNKSMTSKIFQGWKVASAASKVETLGCGRVIDLNMKLRVDGEMEPGSVLGNPLLVWAPVAMLDKKKRYVRPASDMRLWQSVNCSGSAYMKSVRLFISKTRDDDIAPDDQTQQLKFIACALRMLWGYRSDLGSATRRALMDFCKLSKISDPDKIWGPGVWRTLPEAPPRKEMLGLTDDGVAIGKMIRAWHDAIFSKFYLADAWPISAAPADVAPYRVSIETGIEIHEVLKDHRAVSAMRGSEKWRSITRDELERLVWSHPRQQLAGLLGVTDMAIIKRCRREIISAPPRGFWQKIRIASSDEMFLYLIENNTIPPQWWDVQFSKERSEILPLGERIVSVQADSVEA